MRVNNLYLGTNARLEISAQNNMVQFWLHYGVKDQGLSVILSQRQLHELHEYLDMENVEPFVADSDEDGVRIRVIQEPDGRTWIRIFHVSGTGKLIFLTDDETGQLYEWLGALLDQDTTPDHNGPNWGVLTG